MYCSNCSREIPEGTRFCSHCGANVGSGRSSQDYAPVDYSAKVVMQPMQAQPRKGMPVWGWLLIGCALLMFLPIISCLGIASIGGLTLMSTRTEASQQFAQSVLSTIRSAEAAYYSNNGKYGDLNTLANDGYVDSRFTSNNITSFDGRTGFNITFKTDGQHFSCTISVPNVGELTLDESGTIGGL